MADGQVTACLGLGSNIDPERYLPEAINRLHRKLTIVKISSAWESPPVGAKGPNFINAAVLIRTGLTQSSLKRKVIRPIEKKLGRERSRNKNAPRTIDIDILIWDGKILDPQLTECAHLAVPLSEVLSESLSAHFSTIKSAADHFKKSAALKLRQDIIPLQSRSASN